MSSDSDSFFYKVYDVVRLIPEGRVTSYGAIAEYLGTRGSARMVGWAMNASHHETWNIPAHRVVNRMGLLTGKQHFGGPNVMKQLLESEGIEIANDKVVNFVELFWDPRTELRDYALRVTRNA
ncbi:MAG: MGMT family protein [Bacteroidetes bacterium]|nr:MGMT family protein [Bacteroidota bacterium]